MAYKSHKTGIGIILVGALLFIYTPILTVVAYSFNKARFGSKWKGLTLDWYHALFNNERLLEYVWNSFSLAIASTLISTLIGTFLGFALSNLRSKETKTILGMIYLPIILSDIVMALSLVTFFTVLYNLFGIFELGFATMVIGHVTFQIPFVTLSVKSCLTNLNQKLPEAAADLGATPLETLRYITLPLAKPGIIAGALLAFTLSLDDFVVSFFTAGPGTSTLPVMIYSSVKRGISPEINAVSSLMILLSILLTIISVRFQRNVYKGDI